MSGQAPPRESLLFVTGRLAETLVRRVVADVAERVGFDFHVEVLGVSVAALMHVNLVRQKLHLGDRRFDRVILPGWCQGELQPLIDQWQMPVERGPKEIHDLPLFFGLGKRPRTQPIAESPFDIEILAEINHAPRLDEAELLRVAERYRASGADIIDLGAIPGESWTGVGQAVQQLRRAGLRVSIDSFDQREVLAAVEAGAEAVLSVNSSNRSWAAALDADLVVIPDDPHQLDTLVPTIEHLLAAGRRITIDPVLEPIGFGFTASLQRYYEVRRRWPQQPMLMGIGNLTEMSEVDSAGVNFLLAALCQELRITRVLTTEVIPWARSAVREFDIARRVVKHAVDGQTLPKHLDTGLVQLRDTQLVEWGEAAITEFAARLTDPNYRILVERHEIHVMNRDGYWHGTNPFDLYHQFAACNPKLTAAHAFYLGYELANAVTALTLGKQYRQDQALHWGMLTVAAPRHHRTEP